MEVLHDMVVKGKSKEEAKRRVRDIWDRKGTIELSLDSLRELDLKTAQCIFGRIFIVEALNHFFTSEFPRDVILYRCVSPEFDIVAEGEMIPKYLIESTRSKDGSTTSIKFIKTEK